MVIVVLCAVYTFFFFWWELVFVRDGHRLIYHFQVRSPAVRPTLPVLLLCS